MTTEDSTICVFFSSWLDKLITLYWLLWLLLSCHLLLILSGISADLRVPYTSLMLSEQWSTKVVIIFVVLGGILKASSLRIGCAVVNVSVEAFSTSDIRCGKCMRPCVVSMTTLLFHIKCKPMIGPVNFFITTNWLANVLSLISKISVAIVNDFLTGY